MTPLHISDRVRNQTVFYARANIGYGETTNNSGPFIEALGGVQGQEWCATFAGYCVARAFDSLELPLPFARTPGAKKLVERIANVRVDGLVGVRFMDPLLVQPGDLVCWHRGIGRQGHVGVVLNVDSDGLIHTAEGNVGRPPAKVRVLTHDVSKERLYTFAGFR